MSKAYKNKNIKSNIMKSYREIKYPYNSQAQNLIDKFLVLGYDQKIIDFTYHNCKVERKENLGNRFTFFEFEERPNVVNEICNDYSKELLDNDLILEIIFPNYPQMYFLEKDYIYKPKEINEDYLIEPYSIIFSISPQDKFGSHKSYTGLGFIFYNLQKLKVDGEIDGYLYIPTAYVILSEFPYFYQFNKICKYIYFEIKKENDDIPIDIIIYNIIKYFPSPINKSIYLLFENKIGSRENNNIEIKKILFNSDLKDRKDRKSIPSIFFTQLSGYPIIDINMSFILNLIPPEIVVEVFIFSFLEYDIIFYSCKPDFLNMVMYIFKCFNYPFNDSHYYQNIISVSQENFMSGNSLFVNKKSPTMTGILSDYDPEILATNKIAKHFALDIDNKRFFFLYKEKNNEVEDIMCLFNYIKDCTEYIFKASEYLKYDEKDDFKDGIHLYECIKMLLEELIRRSKKVTSIDYNFRNEKPNFLKLYNDESEMDYIEINNRLLKAFYIFTIQILKNFKNFKIFKEDENIDDDEIISESRVPSFVINIKEEENIQIEEESVQLKEKRELARKAGHVFCESFKNTSKYKSFVIKFCQHHEVIDVYRIPYTFINEIIYYSQLFNDINLKEIKIFEIMKQFYGKNKPLDLEEIRNKKLKEFESINSQKNNIKRSQDKKIKRQKKNKIEIEKEKDKKIFDEYEMNLSAFKQEELNSSKVYLFSFDNFSYYYKKNLRAIINREQEDDKENFYKVKSTNRLYKQYKRNNYYLSQKILNFYITFINNNLKELLNTFKLIKLDKSEKDEINNQEELYSININYNLQKDKNKFLDSEESKNETIDYLYLLQNKSKIDKDIKEKLFGTYDNLEILNVIEDNLILERYFSSYTLIQYSLLNILALTRGIESKIINNKNVLKIICDFCEITKLKSKKYINIYFNIFKTMYQNEEFREKFKIKECLNHISLYLENNSLFLSPENEKFLNDVKDQIDQSEIYSNNEHFKEFVKKNGNFFEINESFFFSKTKKFEYALKVIETIFLGKYEFGGYENKMFDFKYNELDKLYKENKDNNGKKFIPKTPILLYDNTNKILKKYLTNFSYENIPYNDLSYDIISLLFYFKIPIIGDKWINDKKNKKDEDFISKYKKNKMNDKEKKSKSDVKRKQGKYIKKDKESINDEIDDNESLKDSNYELNEILKKIISILYDLYYNIKEKYKSQNN